jgi:hypothetical protein
MSEFVDVADEGCVGEFAKAVPTRKGGPSYPDVGSDGVIGWGDVSSDDGAVACGVEWSMVAFSESAGISSNRSVV